MRGAAHRGAHAPLQRPGLGHPRPLRRAGRRHQRQSDAGVVGVRGPVARGRLRGPRLPGRLRPRPAHGPELPLQLPPAHELQLRRQPGAIHQPQRRRPALGQPRAAGGARRALPGAGGLAAGGGRPVGGAAEGRARVLGQRHPPLVVRPALPRPGGKPRLLPHACSLAQPRPACVSGGRTLLRHEARGVCSRRRASPDAAGGRRAPSTRRA